jgi:hypothetical protein
MDWQTKDHFDSRLDDLDEKIDSIMRHLNINLDEDIEDLDDEDIKEENSETNII